MILFKLIIFCPQFQSPYGQPAFAGAQQPFAGGFQQPMYAQQPFGMPQQAQGMGIMSQARNVFGAQQQQQQPQVVTIGGQQYQVVNIPGNQMQQFQ